jgi:hypothetical protein
MAFEHKPGSGSFFVNDKKEKETHADFNGTFKDLSGKEYYVNVWKNKGSKGEYYSFTIKPK